MCQVSENTASRPCSAFVALLGSCSPILKYREAPAAGPAPRSSAVATDVPFVANVLSVFALNTQLPAEAG